MWVGGCIGVDLSLAYSGDYRARLRAGPGPNTEDIDFKEMCAFIRKDTAPSDVVAFPKASSADFVTTGRLQGSSGLKLRHRLAGF